MNDVMEDAHTVMDRAENTTGTLETYDSMNDGQGAESVELPTPDADTQRERGEGGTPPIDAVVEAMVFSSSAPLVPKRIAEIAGARNAGEVRDAIERLNARYEAGGFSFQIVKLAGGYQMLTRPEYDAWVAKLDQQQHHNRLGDAALETLAIVAYRQPIIRADIEAIRGVACGEVLTRLREHGLIRITGRAEVVGRPLLYGTTKRFLEVFGLGGLEDLPPMEQFGMRQRSSAAAEPPSTDNGEAGSAT